MPLAKIPHVISVSASITKMPEGKEKEAKDYAIDCIIKDESYYNGRTIEDFVNYAKANTRITKRDVLDSITLALKQEKADPSRNITRVDQSLRLNGNPVQLADVVNMDKFEDGEITVRFNKIQIKRADIYISKIYWMGE